MNFPTDTVEIVDYCSSWKELFAIEATAIKAVLPSTTLYLDHVGSTSVEGMPSKPVIDILMSLPDWNCASIAVRALKKMGYELDESCDDTPRYFLIRRVPDRSQKFHVHVCRSHSPWGLGMLVFRNALVADDNLAADYGILKKKLAIVHHNDVQAYGYGKMDFIDRKLAELGGQFSVNKLLAHQRAESTKAENLQICMMLAQFLIALLAAFSVYLSNNVFLYILAAIGFFLILWWLFLNRGQQKHRSAGDQARRAVLLISGLKMGPSAGQLLRIIDCFNVPISHNAVRREEDHFATREGPGNKRLCEMIEESSYWTRDLQKASANAMAIILLIFIVIAVLATGAAIASMESDNLISFSRALIAMMVFLISSDLLGLLLSYYSSGSAIDEIFKRVESAVARNFPESDILLLMSDYNAVVERAPPPLPWIYEFRQKNLSQRWQAYIATKHTDVT